MLLITLCVYALGGLFIAISRFSTKTSARKIRGIGFGLLIEIGYSLVLFNIVNIVTSLSIAVD